MSLRNRAYIAGAFEHPTRLAPDKSTPQLHAECAAGALADAGLSLEDVDGYFCATDAPRTPIVIGRPESSRLNKPSQRIEGAACEIARSSEVVLS